jgi:hypothetical protein
VLSAIADLIVHSLASTRILLRPLGTATMPVLSIPANTLVTDVLVAADVL